MDKIILRDRYVGYFEVLMPPHLYSISPETKQYIWKGKEAIDILDKALEERLCKLLKAYPDDEFVTLKESSTYIGVSERKLSNSKVFNNRVWKVNKNGEDLFLLMSILLFKSNRNGLFDLSQGLQKARPLLQQLKLPDFCTMSSDQFKSYIDKNIVPQYKTKKDKEEKEDK